MVTVAVPLPFGVIRTAPSLTSAVATALLLDTAVTLAPLAPASTVAKSSPLTSSETLCAAFRVSGDSVV